MSGGNSARDRVTRPARATSRPGGLKGFVLSRLLRSRAKKPVTYIVPTPLGLLYLTANVSLFVAAALYRNDVLYVHGFSLLSLFFLAMIQTHGNVRRVEAQRAPLSDPFAGGEFSLVVSLRNPAKAGATLLRLRAFPVESGIPKDDVPQARLERVTRYALMEYAAGLGAIQARLVMRAVGRGRFPPLRLFLSTRYPFGLFLAWRVFDVSYDSCVTPAPGGPLPLPLGAGARGEDGEGEDARRRAGPELQEPRSFRFGDPPARVLWRRYVPGAIPLVRQVEDEADKAVRLAWSSTAPAGGLEARLSQMAAWLLECRARNHACRADFPGFASAEMGEADFEPALRALAVVPVPREAGTGPRARASKERA